MKMGHMPLTGMVLLLWGSAWAQPPVVDDAALSRSLVDGLGKVVDGGKALTGEELAKAAADAPRTRAIELPAAGAGPGSNRYDEVIRSVFILGSIYHCGKCDDWHRGGGATAWALTADGVMVTNHHVFEKATGSAMGVCCFEGRVYPITEILASDPDQDLAVFRVETGGTKLQPLVLGGGAPVGTRLTVMSHPDGRYFFQTSGEVARYLRHPAAEGRAPVVRMSITADYAKGSSGGPVVNAEGEVVGIAAATQSIYYGAPEGGNRQNGPLQMVVKNCVPVAALRAMVLPDS
jgi:serine protease Do